MKGITKDQVSNKPVFALLGILVIVCIAFPLLCAWKGYPLYRDIHLGTAIEYTKTAISLQETRIVGFNATGTPTIQEFPIWQMLAAIAFKTLGPWWGWANLVSILIFTTSLFPLYSIAKSIMGKTGAAWTLVFYLSQPLVFYYYGLASTDGTAITASLWFCFFGYRLLTSPTFSPHLWLGAFIAGTFAAHLKLPFFMTFGLGLFFFQILSNPRDFKKIATLGSIGISSALIFLGWTKHTDQLQANALFAFVDLRFSNPEIKFWYFGDWDYRLSPGNWIKGAWRILNTLFGSFVLVGLCMVGLKKCRPLLLPVGLLLGCGIITLIFSHLVLHHSHYYLMFSPAVALLCANALLWIENSLRMNRHHEWIFAAFVGALLALSLIQGLIGMKITAGFDPYYQHVARIVEQHTAIQDKILVQGGGWGGDTLIRANRSGLSIWNTEILEKEANFEQLKKLGYNKLVMISESPILHAVQISNPGQSGKQREVYQKYRTPIVEKWTTIYADEDIIIQEIP